MTEYDHRMFYSGFEARDSAKLQPRIGRRGPVSRSFVSAAFLGGDLLAVLLALGSVLLLEAQLAGAGGDALLQIQGEAPRFGILALLTAALFSFGGLYSRRLGEIEEIRRLAWGTALIALFDLGLNFLPGSNAAPWHLAAWPLFAVAAILLRTLIRAVPAVRRALTTHVILFGEGISGQDFAYQLRENPTDPVRLLRAEPLALRAAPSSQAMAELVRREAGLAGIAPERVEIVLVPGAAERAAAGALANTLESLGQPFAIALPAEGLAGRKLRLRSITGLDLVLASRDGSRGASAELMAKRVTDILAAGLALAVLAPFFLVTIALIRLEGSSAFFAQTRIGRDGRRFRCLKFRSMRPDAEKRLLELLASDPEARAQWTTHQKLLHDPRVTRIGRFLRQTSLDELPQLINVLRGEMSLVGPRPIVAPEVPGYDSDHAYYRSPAFANYAACIPGITGLWQVSGRASTSHEERVRLDGWYARNWSFWLDIAILFRTLRLLLRRTGH